MNCMAFDENIYAFVRSIRKLHNKEELNRVRVRRFQQKNGQKQIDKKKLDKKKWAKKMDKKNGQKKNGPKNGQKPQDKIYVTWGKEKRSSSKREE